MRRAASETTPTGVRVLVVDDDVVICRQMAANLSSAGYQVVTAHDGARALAQAEETQPDLAIVDLEMPRPNGLDVIQKLKGMFGTAVHIIVMTGHDDEVSHAEAFEAGTDRRVDPGPSVLESVLEVSAPSLGRGVAIAIDCKADLMARFDLALVERVLHNLVGTRHGIATRVERSRSPRGAGTTRTASRSQ